MTRRILHVWFPHWRTDLWRRQQEGGKPTTPSGIALYTYDHHRNIVIAVDQHAQQRGVTPGMTIAQARHLAPGLTIALATPAQDAAALEDLARWFSWVAPWCAPAPPDGIWIDITGSAHLHGGEASLLQTIQTRMEVSGHHAVRLAISDTTGASYALTHFGAETRHIVPPAGQVAVLDPLPIAALQLEPATLADLNQMGVTRIHALRKMPLAPLVRRFGPQLAHHLNTALGLRDKPLQPLTPTPSLIVRRSLREPIMTAEAIAIAMEVLLVEICPLLQKRGQGVRRLSLICERVDRAAQSVSIVTAEPVNDPAYLLALLKNRIAHIEPGFGIEAMRVHVTEAAPVLQMQHGLLAATSDHQAARYQLFLDHLHNKPGVRAVFRLVPAPSAIPERAQARQDCLSVMPRSGEDFPVFAPRPARLLHPAEPIRLVTADMTIIDNVTQPQNAPPRSFRWHGRIHHIRRAEGPERLHGEWWHTNTEYGATRDYWHVEDEQGRGFWLYRRGDGVHHWAGDQSWFVHGLF
ncbi:DNA polymerase Y family protein [Candidatus Kirkpatrickella diaphorinae]|uniref:DNA-directed DNA polymerase n=1 Tax=Candidatus Kirkpatrickella diaphorinae TaxID=2984322 RepID=A0ABY6GJJ6_9PROT|nr:DUF6504 family protein [Candidatus Kirkpatrickella diaphorinae]UYH51010.1 DNA polymerase Y family protein [Candidatus Kirkpatrickella diaphorinae]